MCKQSIESGGDFTPQFEKRGGLLPVIVQDSSSGQVLMLGYANREALEMTREKNLATFFSTSRQCLWTKGETSGDFLAIKEILVDCDQDCLLYKVEPAGAGACHTRNSRGETRKSCFFRKIARGEKLDWLDP